jgi:1,4-dihydroxy-2-naphthoate octaprenyltransferase
MKLFNFTRHSEWWEYKLVPLLAISYSTMQVAHYPLDRIIFKLIFSLIAIIIGAVYVSVINDITDIEEDLIAGKTNRLSSVKPLNRIITVVVCISAGVSCGFFIYPDRWSLFFYFMAWVVFSLYSIPPIRLKKRGIWGVLCDAMGAHLFPTLFLVSALTQYSDSAVSATWYAAVGVWSLAYGLRGILWHQFYDRSNDLKSGTSTFASRINPQAFRLQELMIFTVEIAAFLVIFIATINIWTILSLLLYITLVLIRTLAFHHKITLIITPLGLPHQILMNDFYLVFFPLALLFTSAISGDNGWLILCCHLLLFPRKTMLVIHDGMTFLRSKLKN